MTISNRYEGFDSEDDDEETMVNALSSVTPHVKIASRQKRQKQLKNKKTNLAYLSGEDWRDLAARNEFRP